jgi:16S rRNA (guanine1207-N2)-methyltransferase
VIVDGAKSDGVESLLKACRARVDVAAVFSKAHGKVFSFRAGPGFADWTAAPREIEGGFVTLPGVFSADGIDPGSRMLAAHLPATLGRTVVDLGGGWGYLGARALERAEIERLHLVEADHDALDCARRNVPDPRLRLHWEDAMRWHAPAPVDSVIMNPPFHSGRAPDPAMGAAFIRAAAAMLTPGGQLWMVGNRHLPYEPVLAEHFARSEEVAGDTRFKILHAARPSRLRRRDALG